jgi:translation elongation factor EF-G
MVPEEFMGTIGGDINSRRGRIEGMEHVGEQPARKTCNLPRLRIMLPFHTIVIKNGRADSVRLLAISTGWQIGLSAVECEYVSAICPVLYRFSANR